MKDLEELKGGGSGVPDHKIFPVIAVAVPGKRNYQDVPIGHPLCFSFGHTDSRVFDITCFICKHEIFKEYHLKTSVWCPTPERERVLEKIREFFPRYIGREDFLLSLREAFRRSPSKKQITEHNFGREHLLADENLWVYLEDRVNVIRSFRKGEPDVHIILSGAEAANYDGGLVGRMIPDTCYRAINEVHAIQYTLSTLPISQSSPSTVPVLSQCSPSTVPVLSQYSPSAVPVQSQ